MIEQLAMKHCACVGPYEPGIVVCDQCGGAREPVPSRRIQTRNLAGGVLTFGGVSVPVVGGSLVTYPPPDAEGSPLAPIRFDTVKPMVFKTRIVAGSLADFVESIRCYCEDTVEGFRLAVEGEGFAGVFDRLSPDPDQYLHPKQFADIVASLPRAEDPRTLERQRAPRRRRPWTRGRR